MNKLKRVGAAVEGKIIRWKIVNKDNTLYRKKMCNMREQLLVYENALIEIVTIMMTL